MYIHKVTLFNMKRVTNNSIDYVFKRGVEELQRRLATDLVGLWYKQEMFLSFLCFKYKA